MASLDMTKDEREAFLADTHVCVLSVINDGDRPPHASPVWYGYEPGGTITFFSNSQGRTSRKSILVERAGKVAITVQSETFPYRFVTVEGTVTRADRPPPADGVLAIVRRYLPEEQAQGFVRAELDRPDSTLVLFTIRPDRWLSADYAKAG
jgi:PPOX class probable F420-dependent enzyme